MTVNIHSQVSSLFYLSHWPTVGMTEYSLTGEQPFQTMSNCGMTEYLLTGGQPFLNVADLWGKLLKDINK